MRISTVSEAFNAEWRKTEAVRKADKPVKGKAAVDRSEFSSNARRLNETKAQAETVLAHLTSAPEVRTEKIAEVKRKIDAGFYDTEEFADRLADKLIRDFGMGQETS